MKETRTEVRVYEVRAFCECGGEFVPTSMQKLIYPPLNCYECKECKRMFDSTKTYPRVEYEPVGRLCECGASDELDGTSHCEMCRQELEEAKEESHV